jgi:hypothetical protein
MDRRMARRPDRDEAPDLDALTSGFDNVVPLHHLELVK